MTAADGLGIALAGLFAGAVGLGEAALIIQLPKAAAFRLWLRRLPLRWLAVMLLMYGLQHHAQAAADGVRCDLDGFLLRAAPVRRVAMEGAWVAVGWSVAGLLLARAVFPPAVTAAIGLLVAFVQISSWLAIVRCFPLVNGRASWLLILSATVVMIALGVSITGWRSAGSGREVKRLQRLGGRMLLTGLVVGVWLFGDPAWGAWAPATVGVLLGVAGLSTLWWPEAGEGRRPRRLRRLVVGVAQQQPAMWLRVAISGCLMHWLILSTSLPHAAAGGRRLLHRLAVHPQLMTLRADPSAEDWELVNARLGAILSDYRPHPWCGQWMLLVGWIESTRLHHFQTATIVLRHALVKYPRARAVPPPGWAEGHRVGGIASQMMLEWGRVLDPGREPA